MIWALAGTTAAAALLAASYYFSERVLRIPTHKTEAILAYELERGSVTRERLDALPKEEFAIDSPFGYKLHAWFVPADGGKTGRTVAFVHGVTSSSYGMVKYADLFLRRGFNVVLYDHRRHGRSGGDFTTYGYYEKRDLAAVVDWAYDRFGRDAVVGVFGESMGAATALQFAAMDRRPAFVVADCPYSDLTEQLAYRLKAEFRLPRFPLLPITSLWCKLRAGFFFREVSPARDGAAIAAPVLLIHGREDDYVPPWMSETVYERLTCPKSMYLAPGAAHAESWARGRESYERELDAFLGSLGLLRDEAGDPVEGASEARPGRR
ncbi:alpha/beta fold hydrolase [Paenibacillus antri]|uniref:Alpha/beta fold hydrolase n=1 Tax=Paenibacillus antri TaxID=2582848 RepID=A0A5R9G516_9BACL|nr:alpha/beta fold hydrolase [Paenibacillus antri]TLS49426.1 alpha/beta fold hydrolase [Paenibacillus antri]